MSDRTMANQLDTQARSIFAALRERVAADGTGAEFSGLTLMNDGRWAAEYFDPEVGTCMVYGQSVNDLPGAIKDNVSRLRACAPEIAGASK